MLATKVFILCFLSIIMIGTRTSVHALVRRYRFQLINSSHTKVCATKTMLTVNGEFAGPTIYARRGDLVIVDIINRADQNITIHWHGVKMPRYPWNDGTNFITQCPIAPGTRFTQRMILSDEEGTLFWHAHSDWSRATVHGAIIILPPKKHKYPFPKPHAQVPILLGEWWNGDVQKVMEGFFATGRDSRVCDAFLINGQPGDMYPCSLRDTFKLKVEVGKTYMIRMINTMLNYIVHFRIAGHNVTIVGTDAAYTKPLTTDYVAISPGQTVDILLEANQPPGHYYMAAKAYAKEHVYAPATGIIEYAGTNLTPPPSPPQLPYFPELSTWTDSSFITNQFFNKLRSLADGNHPIHVPQNLSHSLFFTLSTNLWPCHGSSCEETTRMRMSVNNVSMLLPRTTDILDAYYRGIDGVFTAEFPDFPPNPFDYTHDDLPRNESSTYPRFATAVKVLEHDAEVEIVFQGTNRGEGFDHPIHLHGHSFFVVGSGFGNYDPEKDPAGYNLFDPPLMETLIVPRLGWATIRFKANNPGVWFMHCHFDRHQSWGMKMAFIVKDGKGPNEKMLPPPPDMPHCGRLSSEPLQLLDRGKINDTVESKKYRS